MPGCFFTKCQPLYQKPIHTHSQRQPVCNKGLGIVPNDTISWRLEEPGTELLTFWVVDNPLYLYQSSEISKLKTRRGLITRVTNVTKVLRILDNHMRDLDFKNALLLTQQHTGNFFYFSRIISYCSSINHTPQPWYPQRLDKREGRRVQEREKG